MLDRAARHFVNHLLASEAWARARLRPFAGQRARFELGPLSFVFVVDADGTISPSYVDSDSAHSAVSIRLPDNAPLLALTDRDAVFAAARISGSADFAEALGFIARNLRWDVEADLARVVGDVAAHRLVDGGRSFIAGKGDAATRLAANVGEYLSQETATLARSSEIEAFCRSVDGLRDDLARLEARLARMR